MKLFQAKHIECYLICFILGFFGPAEYHSHSSNEYESAPTSNGRKRRLNRPDDSNSNDKEMISFIQPNGNTEVNDKTQKDIQ